MKTPNSSPLINFLKKKAAALNSPMGGSMGNPSVAKDPMAPTPPMDGPPKPLPGIGEEMAPPAGMSKVDKLPGRPEKATTGYKGNSPRPIKPRSIADLGNIFQEKFGNKNQK